MVLLNISIKVKLKQHKQTLEVIKPTKKYQNVMKIKMIKHGLIGILEIKSKNRIIESLGHKP